MKNPFRSRNLMIGAGFVTALGALAVGQFAFQGHAVAQATEAPKFEIDPYWPKPLPNHWVLGMSIGVWVDNNDHIWMVHRANTVDRTISQLQNKQGECCQAAPPVLEFDEAGRMKPSAYYDRVVDVMEELMKFTLLTRDVSGYLVDRYSERKESAEKLSQRVNQRAI